MQKNLISGITHNIQKGLLLYVLNLMFKHSTHGPMISTVLGLTDVKISQGKGPPEPVLKSPLEYIGLRASVEKKLLLSFGKNQYEILCLYEAFLGLEKLGVSGWGMAKICTFEYLWTLVSGNPPWIPRGYCTVYSLRQLHTLHLLWEMPVLLYFQSVCVHACASAPIISCFKYL